jgi:hypothetical protein
MRKAKMFMLLAALASTLAGGRVAQAAAGVGLEWGMGPTIPMSNFGMKMNEGFTLAWKVTDAFSVGVFRESGNYRGEHEYTVVATALKHSVILEGTSEVSGIRLMTVMPVISILEMGIELGTLSLGAGTYSTSRSDGGAAAYSDFGLAAPAFAGGQAPMAGVSLKATLLKGETKTVTTAIAILAGYRFVDFNDAYLLGTQETLNVAVKKIDAVSGYDNVNVGLVIGLWF